MNDYKAILTPDKTYHIYNRANGNEKLFNSPENYKFFLEKYKQHIHPIADTFCYCLMPNHFHLIIRIKSKEALLNLTGLKDLSGFKGDNKYLQGFENKETFIPTFITQQFSNFFNSYSKAFNKQEGRKGSLFIRPFKRKQIDSTYYLQKVVRYIHFNPVEAEMCLKPENYNQSSYNSLISETKTLLCRKETISWFDDLENFKFIHTSAPELSSIDLTFL